MASMPPAPIDIVRSFLAAMAIKDYDAGLPFIAADCAYHNMPMAKVYGPAGVRAVLEPFLHRRWRMNSSFCGRQPTVQSSSPNGLIAIVLKKGGSSCPSPGFGKCVTAKSGCGTTILMQRPWCAPGPNLAPCSADQVFGARQGLRRFLNCLIGAHAQACWPNRRNLSVGAHR